MCSLLAAIPFDWIPSQSLEAVEALSIAKLGRLFRLGRFIKKMDQFTAARAIRVVNLLILVLLCTHFFACIWWKVGWAVQLVGESVVLSIVRWCDARTSQA